MDNSIEKENSNGPQHVAIIMDGNGRWAEGHKKPRIWGHKRGVESVRRSVEFAVESGLKVLTLYAFSDENWQRAPAEVNGIMELLNTYILKERDALNKNNIRLRVIGDPKRLPDKTRDRVAEACEFLKNNSGLLLQVALSYGARNEITHACRSIAEQVVAGQIAVDDISIDTISANLWTAGVCDPDLLIRTSGEQRISNFLLWQLAYTEIWFTPVYWPEFSKQHFSEALDFFRQRQRRFGRETPRKVEKAENESKDHLRYQR